MRERTYPLIVPYPAGGGTGREPSDVTARLLARDLEVAMGKPVTSVLTLSGRQRATL